MINFPYRNEADNVPLSDIEVTSLVRDVERNQGLGLEETRKLRELLTGETLDNADTIVESFLASRNE